MPWSDAFCYLWIIHLHIQRNQSLLSILKQVKIQYQPTNGYSLALIHSERGRARGVLLGILYGGDVPHGSPNPDPIIKNDRKMSFSTPVFRPDP